MSDYTSIGKEMDAIMANIAKHEKDVKTFSDKAMNSLDLRNEAQAELLAKQSEVFDALNGIQAFIASLTSLPDEVTNADSVHDAEVAANVPTPVVTTPPVVDPVAPVEEPIESAPVQPSLGLPGADTLDTTPVDSNPVAAPEPVTPVADPEPVVEQPVTFEEPVAGDLGLIGEAPVVGPTPTEPEPTTEEVEAILNDDTPFPEVVETPPAPAEVEVVTVEEDSVGAGEEEVTEEPADEAEPAVELDLLTGLPKAAL